MRGGSAGRPFEAAARRLLVRTGLYHLDARLKKALGVAKYRMSHPPYGAHTSALIDRSLDVVRYASVALAVHRLRTTGVPGAFAEVGVYQGDLSRFLAAIAPDRLLHLFDTFSGFPPEDSDPEDARDDRFRDTSIEAVRRRLRDYSNVEFHPGYFPATAAAVAGETFAFVMLDLDKYQATWNGLEFFLPRLSRGGYLFVHDYHNPESEYAVSRAVNRFFVDRPEQLIELPDAGGSVVVRKA